MKKNNITQKLDSERKDLEEKFKKKKGGVLEMKTAKQWMIDASSRPIPMQLLGSLFYEEELSILFADTNVGKSILAVQLADALSKGKGMIGLKNEAGTTKVLYLDFELSDKQFEMRYSNNNVAYCFHENFLRAQIDLEQLGESDEKLEHLILQSIEQNVLEKEIKVIIIDNITFLGNDMEKSRHALPLMKELQALKKKYHLSFLILSHVPKKDNSKPITNNDVAGSKMLINFADSAFAIGKSSEDPGMRYIKQIKVRNSEEMYGSNNVLVCELLKQGSFLQFKLIGMDYENNHLESHSVKNESDIDFQDSIKELLINNPELSNREIAKTLETNHQKVGRHIEKMKLSGTLV